MLNQKHLIVIGGATASGKTATAIAVAKHFGTVILSADSRQFYREMSIGTAKPDELELSQVEHYFINSISVHDEYTVGDFEKQAMSLLARLFDVHDVCVLVGGSGLFIRALCEGLDEFPDVPKSIVERLEEEFQKDGIAALQSSLKHADPKYYEQVDLYNPQRLIRALSVIRATGLPFSSFRTQTKKERFFEPVYILLEHERTALYNRINQRVDEMMRSGLLEEARRLFPLRRLNALQTVGYQELFDHFDGKCSLEEAVEKIKQNSRRYAKRQITWFRKAEHWKAFHPEEFEDIVAYLDSKMVVS